MNPDRDALIAGIAADPDNDLRRLVVADWLDEHGEPERAEFVRLQIEAGRLTDAAELKPLHARIKELFTAHAADWFGPFLTALNPMCSLAEYFFNPVEATNCVISSPQGPRGFYGAFVRRGFVESLTLDLAEFLAGGSIDAALLTEPVSRLIAYVSANPQDWTRFSEPGLRHLRELHLMEYTATGSSTGCRPAFNDSHLPAVRTFVLELHDSTAGQSRPVPVPIMQLFANSPMAYRVTDLTLQLEDAGLRALCRSDRLRLDKLTVRGTITPAGVRLLNAAPFAPALRSLTLYVGLTDEGAASLARATRFTRLTELDLSGNDLTDAGLRALAVARFLPQLEVLDLSENCLEPNAAAPGLHALADALNPDALRELRLTYAGFVTPPAFLTDRFGNRVIVC